MDEESVPATGAGHALHLRRRCTFADAHCQELFVSLLTVEGRPLIGHLKLKNTNYVLRAARPQAAYRPAGGWPPAGLIVDPITTRDTLLLSQDQLRLN
jgi:hypothetical protein